MLSSSFVVLRILYLEAFSLIYWIGSLFFYVCIEMEAYWMVFDSLQFCKGLFSKLIDLVSFLTCYLLSSTLLSSKNLIVLSSILSVTSV
jgi:hypothetical protein